MDPISLTLGIVSTVLSNLITDLVSGKTKVKRREEIRSEIADLLLVTFKQANQSGGLKPQDLEQIRQVVLDELAVVVTRNPNFVVSEGEIALKAPILKKPLPFKKQDVYIKQELQAQLHQMDEIVNKRRQELGLPDLSPGGTTMPSNITASEIKTTQSEVASNSSVEANEPEPSWKRELSHRIEERYSK